MALVLIVTVVSVTAAWFSNVASTKEDGFTINSTTLKESANITIGDDSIGESNTMVWPAVLNPGTMLKNGEYPRGKALKNTGENIGKNIAVAAKTAVYYFPINFIGSSDLAGGKSIDGRRSLMLKLDSAKLASGETVDESTDYKSKFNVEMCLVTLSEDKKVATEINLDGVFSDALSGTSNVYYYQKTEKNGEPCDEFYMLIIPGEEYYVKATIYFNEVDEQYDDLLYLKGKTLKFDFMLTTVMPAGVNIRAHKPSSANP